MLVHHFLESSTRTAPTAIALIDPQRETSYADLDALANRFANAFLAQGLTTGDRVSFVASNDALLVEVGTLLRDVVAFLKMPPRDH